MCRLSMYERQSSCYAFISGDVSVTHSFLSVKLQILAKNFYIRLFFFTHVLFKNSFFVVHSFLFIFVLVFLLLSMFNWLRCWTNQLSYNMISFNLTGVLLFTFFPLFLHLPKPLEKKQSRCNFWIFVYQGVSFWSLTNEKTTHVSV